MSVRVPSFSIVKTWISLSSLQATSRSSPSGVIIKLRGWRPVRAYPHFSKVPSSLILNMDMPSFSRRCDVYIHLPEGCMCISALPPAFTSSAWIFCTRVNDGSPSLPAPYTSTSPLSSAMQYSLFPSALNSICLGPLPAGHGMSFMCSSFRAPGLAAVPLHLTAFSSLITSAPRSLARIYPSVFPGTAFNW